MPSGPAMTAVPGRNAGVDVRRRPGGRRRASVVRQHSRFGSTWSPRAEADLGLPTPCPQRLFGSRGSAPWTRRGQPRQPRCRGNRAGVGLRVRKGVGSGCRLAARSKRASSTRTPPDGNRNPHTTCRSHRCRTSPNSTEAGPSRKLETEHRPFMRGGSGSCGGSMPSGDAGVRKGRCYAGSIRDFSTAGRGVAAGGPLADGESWNGIPGCHPTKGTRFRLPTSLAPRSGTSLLEHDDGSARRAGRRRCNCIVAMQLAALK